MARKSNDPTSVRTSRLRANAQGYWEIWFTEQDGTPDASGRRGVYKTKRLSCRTKDYVDAQAVLAKFHETERANGHGGGSGSAPTVDELCARWLDHVEPLGKAKTGRYVLTQVRHLLGRYTVDQLTDARLQDYQTRRGVSAGSIRRELGGLRTVLRWAAKKKLIAAVSVPEFELPAAAGPRVKFLDRDQEQWFWDQAMAWGTSHRVHTPIESSRRRVSLFVALGLETAARRGAIYDLTWDRVDLAQGTIDYRVPGRRVTKKRRVLVPISDRLAPVLETAWLEAPKNADGRATGRVLGSTGCLRRAFWVMCHTLGVPWVTPHVLRHTWASLAAMNGVSLWDIAQVLGDTIATVEANYLHLTPGHLRSAINHKTRSPVVVS